MNLVNTLYLQNKEKHDALTDSASTLQWLHANQLIREPYDVLGAETLLEVRVELASLRDLCKEILIDLDMGNELAAETFIKLKARAQSLSIQIHATVSEGKFTLNYEGKSAVDHMLYMIIRSIFDTLDTYTPDRIRKCEHEDCILHFVDTSKSGKRRWCSMEACGNRHKAAEFYAKKKLKKSML
ncbi:CGNR zinc finger domain-containing protein [Paenibacillus sedimenti]|uniref:CGNR zinc finger domain-containing protein n=1 Tax=Paenibacillus sedimenti TaxID=2770274 RepID=UPI001CB75581|nr:CGNR zinc finger domain-containing protein [Paenibacillus sedimenti]